MCSQNNVTRNPFISRHVKVYIWLIRINKAYNFKISQVLTPSDWLLPITKSLNNSHIATSFVLCTTKKTGSSIKHSCGNDSHHITQQLAKKKEVKSTFLVLKWQCTRNKYSMLVRGRKRVSKWGSLNVKILKYCIHTNKGFSD